MNITRLRAPIVPWARTVEFLNPFASFVLRVLLLTRLVLLSAFPVLLVRLKLEMDLPRVKTVLLVVFLQHLGLKIVLLAWRETTSA